MSYFKQPRMQTTIDLGSAFVGDWNENFYPKSGTGAYEATAGVAKDVAKSVTLIGIGAVIGYFVGMWDMDNRWYKGK